MERSKGIIKTSFVGIGGNFLIAGTKAVIGLIASSISIILDAVNNLTDALSSLITIIGIKLSGKKPDKKHPYGHGRIEYITSAVIGFIILFSGATAIVESIKSIIDHFQNGSMPDFSILSLFIIAFAVIAKIVLGLFFKRQGKKYESDTLKASGNDALSDAILSTSTLVGAIIAKFAGLYVEGYLGIIIGIFIIKAGLEVILEAGSDIIGRRIDKEFSDKIKKSVLAVNGVLSVHDLIINSYGNNTYIASIHIGIKDDMKAREIQEIEREIAYKMYEEYHVIMTTGIYTLSEISEKAYEIKQFILKMIKDDPNILELHGYFYDENKKVINFDLVFSFDEKEPEAKVSSILEMLNEKYDDYKFICNIDKDY